MDISPDDEVARIWADVLLACHLFETSLERQAQRDGDLAHGHMQILVVLNSRPQCSTTLTELARTLRFSLSRTSHAVTTLEKQGIVDRRAVDEDRRASRVVLTEEGRHLVRLVLQRQHAEIRDPLFAHLGPDRVRLLGDLAHRAVTRLDDSTSEGTIP